MVAKTNQNSAIRIYLVLINNFTTRAALSWWLLYNIRGNNKMDIIYCKSKAKQITEQIQQTEEQIKKYQGIVDQLTQQHIYLQGSLAIVNELLDLDKSEEGGIDETS